MITEGADVNLVTHIPEENRAADERHNYSPLDFAIKNHDEATIAILLKERANAHHMRPTTDATPYGKPVFGSAFGLGLFSTPKYHSFVAGQNILNGTNAKM